MYVFIYYTCLWHGSFNNIKKSRYWIQCTWHVSGITFIRYTHYQKIGKAKSLIVTLEIFVYNTYPGWWNYFLRKKCVLYIAWYGNYLKTNIHVNKQYPRLKWIWYKLSRIYIICMLSSCALCWIIIKVLYKGWFSVSLACGCEICITNYKQIMWSYVSHVTMYLEKIMYCIAQGKSAEWSCKNLV